MARASSPQLGSDRPSVESIARRLWACCLARGWDAAELARHSGVSRTTLYHLQAARIARPRISTLSRLAAAFGLTLEQFLQGHNSRPSSPRDVRPEEHSRSFDRRTNTAIHAVSRDRPELFADWNDAEWDELYSTFGTGGELSAEGVVLEAEKINARRESLHKLAVVMDTHLHDVARHMVESLYRMVVPESNLASSAELSALISRHLQEDGAGSGKLPDRADDGSMPG